MPHYQGTNKVKKKQEKNTLAVKFPAKTCLKEKYNQLCSKIDSKTNGVFDSGAELASAYSCELPFLSFQTTERKNPL